MLCPVWHCDHNVVEGGGDEVCVGGGVGEEGRGEGWLLCFGLYRVCYRS